MIGDHNCMSHEVYLVDIQSYTHMRLSQEKYGHNKALSELSEQKTDLLKDKTQRNPAVLKGLS